MTLDGGRKAGRKEVAGTKVGYVKKGRRRVRAIHDIYIFGQGYVTGIPRWLKLDL